MVTIKGKKISNKGALDSIKAMEDLIYLYKHPEEYHGCPLCQFFCYRCPWYILLDPRRKRNRIRQLERWIEIYKKALKK